MPKSRKRKYKMKRRSGGTNRKEYSKILGINEYAIYNIS